MNYKQLFTLILVTSFTTQGKCPDATANTNENTKLKLGFEIESGTITLIKDLETVTIARNSNKTAKYHIDTLVEEDEHKRWVFENDSPMFKIPTRIVDEALNVLDDTEEKNQDFYSTNFNIDDKSKLEAFAAEFHTEGGLLCDAAYQMADRAFEFYVGLGKKIINEANVDIIQGFITDDDDFTEMGVRIFQPFGEDDFSKDDEKFDQGFLLYINNDHQFTLPNFKGYLTDGYKNVSKALFDSDPSHNNLGEQAKAQKKLECDHTAIHMAPVMADLPTIQATVQIPLELFPSLLTELIALGLSKYSNHILSWLNSSCDDEGAAKRSLCKMIKKAECGGNAINRKVIGLSLIASQFLINGTFEEQKADHYDYLGIKTLFDFQPRVGVKKMFRKLNETEQRDFKCLFAPENYYNDHVLINYKNYQYQNVVNSDDPKTVKNYFDSIFADNDNADLLSPPPGMGASDSMGTLDVPGDCNDCAILEIRAFSDLTLGTQENVFYYIDKSPQNDTYDKEVARTSSSGQICLIKDIQNTLKTFAKIFYELTPKDFDDFAAESSEEERIVIL